MQSLQMTAVKVSFHIIMLKVDNVITYTMPYANHHHDVTWRPFVSSNSITASIVLTGQITRNVMSVLLIARVVPQMKRRLMRRLQCEIAWKVSYHRMKIQYKKQILVIVGNEENQTVIQMFYIDENALRHQLTTSTAQNTELSRWSWTTHWWAWPSVTRRLWPVVVRSVCRKTNHSQFQPLHLVTIHVGLFSPICVTGQMYHTSHGERQLNGQATGENCAYTWSQPPKAVDGKNVT